MINKEKNLLRLSLYILSASTATLYLFQIYVSVCASLSSIHILTCFYPITYFCMNFVQILVLRIKLDE